MDASARWLNAACRRHSDDTKPASSRETNAPFWKSRVSTGQTPEAGWVSFRCSPLMRHWAAVARELETSRIVDTTAARLLQCLACFGDLIRNYDMHLGNFSFWLNGSDTAQPAPVYDMLPMFLAPNQQGEVVARTFQPRAPTPRNQPEWTTAAGWALEFWQTLANDVALSTDFREQAATADTSVARLLERHG